MDPDVHHRIAQPDERLDGVAGQDHVERGVGHVLDAVVPVGEVAGEAGQHDQQVGRYDEERRDDGAVAHLRGTREGRFRRGDPLDHRRQGSGQVDREQYQVEAVDAEHVEPLVAAVTQVAGLGQEVGQRHQAEQRADQRGAERERQQDEQADRAPRDRRHVVPPQEQLAEAGPLPLTPPGTGLAAQLGQDQQAAVGPAAPLDAQRAEVRRRRAVAHPLGGVEQPPAVRAHVDGGLGVLDDRPVPDVVPDLPVADVRRLGDLVERAFADHRVGADPERGVVVGQPLVDDVLQVGGGPGDPLQPGARTGEGAVRRLGDGHVAVLVLLEQVHEPQAVLGQQHAVRVERHDVVRIRDVQGAVARPRPDQRGAGDRLHLAVGAPHQAHVAVKVHGLVGLVGQRHVPLALEAGDLGAERPHQPAVQAAEHLLLEHHALVGRGEQRRADRAQRSRPAAGAPRWRRRRRCGR